MNKICIEARRCISLARFVAYWENPSMGVSPIPIDEPISNEAKNLLKRICSGYKEHEKLRKKAK